MTNQDRVGRAQVATRTVTDDHGHAREYRRCNDCRSWKPADRDHYYGNPRAVAGITGTCKTCKRAQVNANRRSQFAHPVSRADLLARQAAATRRWRKRNPDKVRAMWRNHERRIQADPERRAHARANARIAYRLRAERAGRAISTRGKHATVEPYRAAVGGASLQLDPQPLRQWLEAVIAAEVDDERTFKRLCRVLGWEDRQLRAVRSGEYATVSLHTADRLLTNYGQPVVIRSRDLERRLAAWAQGLPGNGTRLLAYMDRAEAVGHLADVALCRIEDLWPELQEA